MNKGTSQKSRINKALKEDYISLDERSLLDMVQFTLDFSQHINFYDPNNKVTDNWSSFLQKDVVFVLSMIAKSDLKKLKIENSDSVAKSEKDKGVEIYRQKINQIFSLINQWDSGLKQSGYNGILLNEIGQLKSFADGFQKTMENTESGVLTVKEVYDNLFGTLVFIREKASKTFEDEIMSLRNHSPHIGLLLSFLKLYRNVQNDINGLTKKHLDFYYLKILQQKKRKPEPGSAIIGLQLLPGIEEVLVEEDEICEFSFAGNQKLNFVTTSATQINNAKISDIFTLFKSDDSPFDSHLTDDNFSLNILYEEEILRDGKSLLNFELLDNDELPATLGEAQLHNSISDSNKRLSNIGIVVSSPALFLEKGKQKIELTFKISSDSYRQALTQLQGLINQEIKVELEDFNSKLKLKVPDTERIRKRVLTNFFNDAFLIFITNDEGWKQIDYYNLSFHPSENTLTFNLELDEQKDHLRVMDNSIHEGEFESDWPCIKLLVNNATQYHPYKILKNLVVEYVGIETSVEDVTNLILSNSTGTLDQSIPFMPFGPVPVLGSYLQIQNPLIFQKNLSKLTFFINWSGLPQELNGFKDYYHSYPNNIENNSFKAILTQNKNTLNDTGKHRKQEFELFYTHDDKLKNVNSIDADLDNFSFKIQIDLQRLNSDVALSPVFMVLTQPNMAFGHQLFTNIYASAALKNSRFKRKQTPLPNQPYTPVIDRLSVNYTNVAKEVMARKQDEKGSDIKIIHLYPFGHVQTFPGPVKSLSYLLPQIRYKGNLFMGLKEVKPGDVVSIGFELSPAVYINTVINIPKIEWEFLLNNQWEPFGELFLEDTTNDLIKSGLVKIQIPNSIQTDNTWLPPGKFWIRAVYNGSENLNSRIKNIFTQAVSLVSEFSDSEFQNEISADTKTEKISFSGLKGFGKITGPYALEINKLSETEELFYTRNSEQLRHKNRAVTNWDVERLILDKFREIDKVRVYGRNNYESELIKGSSMQIVLIPKNNMSGNIRKRNNKVDFQTLISVKEFVSQMVSPYEKIEVSNPVYEHLKVKCKVKFNNYQKRGTLLTLLNTELVSYFSPDIDTPDFEKGFDESISKTEILNFIESRPYVDFVTEFSVLQLVEVQGRYRIIDTAGRSNVEELRTVSPYAILTSAPVHNIEIIQDEKSSPPKESGVGDLSVEYDFVIGEIRTTEKNTYNTVR